MNEALQNKKEHNLELSKKLLSMQSEADLRQKKYHLIQDENE